MELDSCIRQILGSRESMQPLKLEILEAPLLGLFSAKAIGFNLKLHGGGLRDKGKKSDT